MDPVAVEDWGEEFELVEDVGCEFYVKAFSRSFVADELFGPDKHAGADMIVKDSVCGRRGVEVSNVLLREGFVFDWRVEVQVTVPRLHDNFMIEAD